MKKLLMMLIVVGMLIGTGGCTGVDQLIWGATFGVAGDAHDSQNWVSDENNQYPTFDEPLNSETKTADEIIMEKYRAVENAPTFEGAVENYIELCDEILYQIDRL